MTLSAYREDLLRRAARPGADSVAIWTEALSALYLVGHLIAVIERITQSRPELNAPLRQAVVMVTEAAVERAVHDTEDGATLTNWRVSVADVWVGPALFDASRVACGRIAGIACSVAANPQAGVDANERIVGELDRLVTSVLNSASSDPN